MLRALVIGTLALWVSCVAAGAPAGSPVVRLAADLARPDVAEALQALPPRLRDALADALRQALKEDARGDGAAFDPGALRKTRVIVADPRVSRSLGDDRGPLNADEKVLFSGVGVVEGKGFQGGSGVLVGSCQTVVTAAHNVSAGAGLRTRDVAFLPQGDPAREVRVDWSGSFLPPEGAFLGPEKIAYDVAVLALEEPVPDCRPLGYATLSNAAIEAYADRLWSVGFHRDTGWDPVAHRNCAIANLRVDRERLSAIGYDLDPRGEQDGVLLHHCDTASGSSGSPLLIFVGGKPFVVGINTGAPFRSGYSDDPAKRLDNELLPEDLKDRYPNHGVLFSEGSPAVQALDRQIGAVGAGE